MALHYLLFIEGEALSPGKWIFQGHRSWWQSWEGNHSISSSVSIYISHCQWWQTQESMGSLACPCSWWLILTLPLNITPVLAYNSISGSKTLRSQMEIIKRAGESAHPSLHNQCLLRLLRKSCTIKERQWEKQGMGAVLSFFTGHSSFAVKNKTFQKKRGGKK